MLAFRLYQVEVNHEDEPVTFSKVSGTERAHGEDFVVEEEGKIKRSVEWKNGIYRLDSIDATVSGLPETYFKGYERPNQGDDTPYRPFVFEMREGAEGDAWSSMSAVFHGIVDPNSIQYTQRTGRTKFEVWSWDAVLTQQSDIPARSVVEVDVVEGVDSESILDGNPSLRVPDTQKVEEGDVVEVEQDGITRRSTIEDIDGRNDEDISISLAAPSLIPQEEIEQANPVEFLLGGSFPHNTDGVGADTSMLGFEPTEALKTAIQNKQSGTSFSARIYNTKTGKEKKLESPELVDVDPVDTVSTGRGLIWLATPTKVPSAYYEDVYENPPELSTQNENVYVDIEYANPVESGKTVKVYGRSVYGYDSTFTANVQNDRLITFHPDYNVAYVDSDGNPDGLIPAIFSIGGNDQLDLLRAAVDRFEIDEGAQYKEIDRRKVFPDDIEKSLRAIQRTANLFLAIEPVTSADGTEPRIKVRVIARDDISGMAAEDGSAYIVEDWDEDVIEQKVDAVKVTTHKPEKPSPNYGDVVGWYPAEKNHRFAVLGHNINSDNRDEFVVRGDQSTLLSPGDTFDLRDGDRNQITSFTVFNVYRTDVDEANNRSHVVVEETISDSHDQQNYIFFRAPGKIEPEGAKVVEIKTMARPAFQGEGSADKTNDNRLSELAERFFRFYEEQGVQGKATITVPVDGTPRGLVGSKITFPEPEDASGNGRTVFVTSAEYDRETGKAQIEFRRGDYTEPTGPAVEARANVPSSLRSPGKVVFNGDPSIAQAGADYEWEITSSTNGNVTTGVFGKGRSTTLDLPEGTHNWKLTVTGPEGGTDTTSGTITVKTVGSGLNDPAEIRTDAYEQDPGGSSVREAVLEVDVEAEGGTPEEIEFYVAEGKSIPEGAAPTRTVTSVSNGGTYTETASLSEGHVTTMQAVAIYSDRSVRRSQAYTYDANAVPAPSYSWSWEYDSGADTYDLYLSWKGSTDTASIEVDFDEGADGTVDNTAIANGRNGRVKVNSSAIDTNKTVEIKPVSYNEADQSGVAETNPPTYTITSPFGASEVSGSDDLDSRYVLESGDQMAGPLEFGSAGEIAEGSGSYLEVLAADGTNSGELHLDTLVVDQLDVTGDINQQNENNLAVEDRWIEANVGGGDQNAGLIVNRASTDAYLMWDEGTDRFGQRIGSSGNFKSFVLDRYTDAEAVGAIESHGDALTIDITGDADTVDQYGGNDLAVLAENETITAGWVHKADITLDGASLQTSGAATGLSGSGAVVQSGTSWFDDLGVRGVLSVPELEAKQVTVSKGEKAFGPGGGKVVEVVSRDTSTTPSTTELRFADNPGIKSGDRVLIREVDPATANVRKIELKATGSGTSITFDIVSESNGQPQKGDSVAVVGSSDTSRDSLLYADPYGPYFDALDGISTFSDWNSRSPKARYGYIGGAPNLPDGTSPSGYGLWSENVYLGGHIVAESGEIRGDVKVNGLLQVGGRDVHRFFARGSGLEQSNTDGNIYRELRIDGEKIYEKYGRGLQLTVWSKANGVVANKLYDVHNDTTDQQNLGNVLLGNRDVPGTSRRLNQNDIVILTSYDAIADPPNWSSELANGIERVGGSYNRILDAHQNSPSGTNPARLPYALIGRISSKGAGGEVVHTSDPNAPFAEVHAVVTEDAVSYSTTAQRATVEGNMIVSGTVTTSELSADAVTSNEISVGSVTDIDSDAATINDVFSGNYSDLSGTPSLGDVASLNDISSTYIADGAVVTRTVATDAITATEANFNDLNAVAASIAGWDINSNSIRRYNLSDTNEDVAIGETFYDDHYGISVGEGDSNYARLITHPSGGYELDIKGNGGSDQVYIGNGYVLGNMGMLVKADNTTIFKTSPTTAYIDNLEVRNGATIDGGVTVSGGFSGDQIDVTDLSAVNTNTGSLDVDGTLTMSSNGKITNGSSFRLDDTALQITTNGSYSEAHAITFLDNLQDAPFSSTDFGRIWFNSDDDSFVLQQTAPAGGRLVLTGQNSVDIYGEGGPIKLNPNSNAYDAETMRIVSIPNTQTYGQEGTGIVMKPYDSDGSANADKSDLEDVMGPNEGLIYTMLYPDGNINLAWAETDSNGNIQNRGNTF